VLKNIARWMLLLSFISVGLLYLNSTFYSLWVAGGPPTQVPSVWLHRASVHLGFSVALFATGIFFFKSFKKGLVFTGTKAWSIWLLIILICLGWPALNKSIKIDSCLDLGGKWSQKNHECQRSNT